MANEQNLVPFTSEQNREEAAKNGHKGGVASGKARRERRDRHQRIQELFAQHLKNPQIIEELKEKGIEVSDQDIETLLDLRVAIAALGNGDYKAWQALKEEAYGKLEQKVESTVIAPKPLVDLTERKKNGQ